MESFVDLLSPWGVLALGTLIGAGLASLALLPRLGILQGRLKAQAQARDEAEALQETLRLKMQDVASQALRQNRDDFLTLANQTFTQTLTQANQTAAQDLQRRQEGIGAMLKPLKESVEHYRAQTTAGQGALKQQIDGLAVLGQDMSRQAAALRNALTSGPRGAGVWGEQQLKNIMTMAGMAEHVDFDLQVHIKGHDGQVLRPDALIKLPGQGCIVVDAKAPLAAFVRAHEGDDPQAAQQDLHAFANALRGHVVDLGKKAYWDQVRSTPEFVVLFLPNDAMLTTALEVSPDLLAHATAHKVVLASPGTLIALLTTVAHAWRQESLHENAQEIADLGRKLYDSLASLGGHFDRLHKGISQTAKAYSGMIGSLDRSVMPKARRFRDLQMDPGAKSLGEPKTLEDMDLRDPATLRNLTPVSDAPSAQRAAPALADPARHAPAAQGDRAA